MPVDYSSEMSTVLEDQVPEWFYTLSLEDRNTISNQALVEYTEKTAIKNAAFIIFWNNLIAPYNPLSKKTTPTTPTLINSQQAPLVKNMSNNQV